MGSADTPTLDLEGRQALASVLSKIGSKPVKLGVGRYTLGRALGKGACGEVYLGRDPSLDREVAIKVVLTGRDSDGTGGDVTARASPPTCTRDAVAEADGCGARRCACGARRSTTASSP